MSKGSNNFKQIRKKVIQQDSTQNIPINPINKISFRGIKKNQNPIPLTPIQIPQSPISPQQCAMSPRSQHPCLGVQLQQILSPNPKPQMQGCMNHKNQGQKYLLPACISSGKNLENVFGKQDCNKFSILLESRGFSNSNTSRKKSTEISFRNLGNPNSCNKRRLNTERKDYDAQPDLKTIVSTAQHNENTNPNTSKNHKKQTRQQKIQNRCREIKEKEYPNIRNNLGQLNSLTRLKNKLISPLKKKSESQPEPPPSHHHNQHNNNNIPIQHESMLSEHDLVNMSKTNDSIRFDMSPCL